ncbi:MAG: hypothetical protein V4510_01825 [bacterium]
MTRPFTAILLTALFMILVPASTYADPVNTPPGMPTHVNAAYDDSTNTVALRWDPPVIAGSNPVTSYVIKANAQIVYEGPLLTFTTAADPMPTVFSIAAITADGEGPAAIVVHSPPLYNGVFGTLGLPTLIDGTLFPYPYCTNIVRSLPSFPFYDLRTECLLPPPV